MVKLDLLAGSVCELTALHSFHSENLHEVWKLPKSISIGISEENEGISIKHIVRWPVAKRRGMLCLRTVSQAI